jgi:hypothetical protein
LQGKPLRKLLSHAYDFGCKMWFRQDGVHLLDDEVRSPLWLSRRQHTALTCPEQVLKTINNDIDLTCSERFRGSVPLLPVLRPYHGYWIARKPADDDVIDEEEEQGLNDTLNTSRYG